MAIGISCCSSFFFFFFNDTATTEIYTLSLHDALPILDRTGYDAVWLAEHHFSSFSVCPSVHMMGMLAAARTDRSEEHTSELQSQSNLVCRLLLEKKKKKPLTSLPLTINL